MSPRIQRWVPSPRDLVTLDHGRCCGRKATAYKRPIMYFSCPRCDRRFNALGNQIENWAWRHDDAKPNQFKKIR